MSNRARRHCGTVLILVALVVAGCSSAPPSVTPPPSTAASPAESPSPTQAATAVPTPAPTPKPTATPVAEVPSCAATSLAARITAWDHGAGHATAHVEVTNKGAAPCRLRAVDRPQLVDGNGSVLINAGAPAASSYVTMTAGAILKTLVDASNYCGPTPLAPVSVAFVFPGGTGRFVATPLSPSDTSGIPPCNGAPGSAGSIAMQDWAP